MEFCRRGEPGQPGLEGLQSRAVRAEAAKEVVVLEDAGPRPRDAAPERCRPRARRRPTREGTPPRSCSRPRQAHGVPGEEREHGHRVPRLRAARKRLHGPCGSLWARTGSPRYHRARDTAASRRRRWRRPPPPGGPHRARPGTEAARASRRTPLARGEIVALGSTARASMASANSSSASALDAPLRRRGVLDPRLHGPPLRTRGAPSRVTPPGSVDCVEPLPRPLWTTAGSSLVDRCPRGGRVR